MKTVGGLLLAAGRSSRMPKGCHKLLAEFDRIPLVRKSAETMLSSHLGPVVVVTGHRSSEVEMALRGLPLFTTYNPNFLQGMGTSLACGLRHEFLADFGGILVMLADMPKITTAHINKLLAAFQSSQDVIVRGSDGQTPGHPVIVPSALFSHVRKLDGDQGAKEMLQQRQVPVRMIDLGKAALEDVDTLEDLISAGGRLYGYGSAPPQ